MEQQQPKRPRVDKDKFAAQLVKLSDFEVEQVLRIVQEENDRRNLEWMKAQPDYVPPHALRSDEYVAPVPDHVLKRLDASIKASRPMEQEEEIEELD